MPVTPLPISDVSAAPDVNATESGTGRHQLQACPGYIHHRNGSTVIANTTLSASAVKRELLLLLAVTACGKFCS